jgi:hypothetical protein
MFLGNKSISEIKTEKLTGSNKVLLVSGHRED